MLFGPWDVSKFGEFGDSFGALTSFFNALAFAALVATVVLQSRELKETRRELAKQAEAPRQWVEATREQLAQTREIETLKIRPVLKAEWFPREDGVTGLYLRLRNVGLSTGVLESLDLYAGGVLHGSVSANDTDEAALIWAQALGAAVPTDAALTIDLGVLNDLNRALGPGEFQAVVHLSIGSASAWIPIVEQLEREFVPVIHFRSLSGERLSTTSQFLFPGRIDR